MHLLLPVSGIDLCINRELLGPLMFNCFELAGRPLSAG